MQRSMRQEQLSDIKNVNVKDKDLVNILPNHMFAISLNMDFNIRMHCWGQATRPLINVE